MHFVCRSELAASELEALRKTREAQSSLEISPLIIEAILRPRASSCDYGCDLAALQGWTIIVGAVGMILLGLAPTHSLGASKLRKWSLVRRYRWACPAVVLVALVLKKITSKYHCDSR